MGRCKPLQSVKASQEARSVCLGRNEPRLPWRLRGQHTGSAAAKPPVGVALPPRGGGRATPMGLRKLLQKGRFEVF